MDKEINNRKCEVLMDGRSEFSISSIKKKKKDGGYPPSFKNTFLFFKKVSSTGVKIHV